MNEGKKIISFFMFVWTVGSLWVSQTSESKSGIIIAVLSGIAFVYLLFFWENKDPDK